MLLSICDADLPDEALRSVSEGFAYYALYPETYVASARRFLAEHPRARVCTLGLRNIGASLAPAADARRMSRGEDDDVEAVRGESREKVARAGTRGSQCSGCFHPAYESRMPFRSTQTSGRTGLSRSGPGILQLCRHDHRQPPGGEGSGCRSHQIAARGRGARR